ncbi:cysteine-rich venom protein [Rhipicephalus microplus]|uniref:cysteine-rich venom protein n=1 Tax=Rhipicephalus microplus TaxID=6941 RepID=UPI003F6CB02E
MLVTVRAHQPCPPPYNATHTMCMPPYQDCTTLYSDVPASFVTILWVHNHYRSHLALGHLANFPSAANMLQLRWDDDLAAVADARARRCIGKEGVLFTDNNEQRWTADFPLVGQNVLNQRSKEDRLSVNWEHVVRDWFKQNTVFSVAQAQNHSAIFGAEAFNQMAWARTYAIGCNYSSNEVPAFKPDSKVFIYVCNYGPQSGEIGQPLYQAGEPCSLCPEDTMCDPTTGLCMLQGDKPGPDKTTTTAMTGKPSVLVTPETARGLAAGPVAAATGSMVAAALVAIHMWRQVVP